MLKNKNFNIILALIIAISLWAYVLGDVNPQTDITVKEVPITFTNEDILENSGLVVLESSHAYINITISGARTDVTTVKKGDFRVMADVEALEQGDNVVRLNVSGPDNVEITNVSTDKITVNVDKLVTAEKDIEVVVIGEIEDQKEAYIVELSREQVNVTGAETLVKNVSKVNATVDAKQITGSLKTVSAKLEAVDGKGKVVEHVIMDAKSINVSAVMYGLKTVPLEVNVENADADGYERSVKLPKTIVIKGEESALDAINSITCETLDLSEYKETTKVALTPILPYGVQVSHESANLTAEITVKELSKANIRITKGDIKLQNQNSDYKYELVGEDIVLEVVGKESDLIGIDASDFIVYVDVSDLEEGTHTVKVNVTSKKDLSSIKPSTSEVKIIIK